MATSLPDGVTTLDVAIARNVKRLREEKKWSRRTLAKVLHVSANRVSDMEEPREGREQREFRWWELVALCGALDCTLYELVLPKEGEQLVRSSKVPLVVAELDDGGFGKAVVGNRDEMAWRLFGLPPNYVNDKGLMKRLRESATTEAGKLVTELMASWKEAANGDN